MTTRGVLLDIDGVLVVSWEPLPGAVEAVHAIRTAGFEVHFLTNTTSRTSAEVLRALHEAGFEVETSQLTTAGVATAGHLAEHHPGTRCLVLNDGPLDDLAGVELVELGEPADVVVVGSAGPSFDWQTINRAARALLGGAALVGMHGTTNWRTAEGICVDGGAYLAALERATGVQPTIVGKPAPTMFLQALARAGVDAEEAVMVGDDVVADVLAAQAVGIRGVLVRTGKYRADSVDAASGTPGAIINSIADLPDWLTTVHHSA